MTEHTNVTALSEQAEALAYMPWGNSHREAATSVMVAAQESGDLDSEFAARMRLTAEGVMSGISELALTNFAWCAAKHAEDPARFVGPDGDPSDTIFWQYKWMPGVLMGSPAFSADQVADVLADFDQAYRNAGLPRSAVIGAQFETAVAMGLVDEATALGELAAATPRDDFSSCEACVPANFVDLALLQGDEARAVDIAAKTWRDNNSCAEEPESMLAVVLVPMLRAGRTEEAVEAYELVYDASRGEADQVVNHSFAALFASVTGNHDLALSVLDRQLVGLAHDALDERDTLKASINFAVVLERFARAERADAAVRSTVRPALRGLLPHSEQPLVVTDTAAALWNLADSLASRFDERNGTDYWARRITAFRELVTEEHPVDLDAPEGFTPILVLPESPQTSAEWVQRATDCMWARDLHGALESASHAIELAGADAVTRMRSFGVINSAAAQLGDTSQLDQSHAGYVDAVAERWPGESAALARVAQIGASAEDLATALDAYPEAAALVRVRANLLASRALLDVEGEPAPGSLERADAFTAAAVDIAESAADAADSDSERLEALSAATSALVARAQTRFGLDDTKSAFDALDAAERSCTSRVAQAVVVSLRGNLRARGGDVEAAAECFDESATLFAAAGFVQHAVFAALDAGTAWADADEADSAVARFDFAESLLIGDEELPVGAQWRRALALIDAGEADRAVPILEAILASEQADPATEPGAIAQTYFRLGRAYDEAYDTRAAAMYRAAAESFAQDDAPLAAAQAYLHAARENGYQQQWHDAIADADSGLGLVAANPEPILEMELLKAVSYALVTVEDPAWRARAEQAVDVARGIGDPAAVVSALQSLGGFEAQMGDLPRSTAIAQESLDLALENALHDEALGALWQLSNAVLDAHGVDQAFATLERYRARREEFGEDQDSLKHLGAEVLARGGRDDLSARWTAAFES